MRSLIALTLAPLAFANDLSKRSVLLPRQGSDAFIPGSTPVFDCQYPCGATDCLLPSRGDRCCIEGYACPGGSFCLTKGYCCPDGDDPATCATQFGISLPNGFKPGQTVAVSVSSSTAAPRAPSSSPIVAPSPSTPAAAPVTPASTPLSSSSSSSSSTIAPFPTPLVSNTTLLAPPTTATGTSAPGGSVVPFRGGAVRVAIDGIIGAMAFAGAVWWLV